MDILAQIKENSQNYPPGILPPGKTMDSLIGHTVINISDTPLDKPQIEALQKGLTFCPTPGPPQKSLIWKDIEDWYYSITFIRTTTSLIMMIENWYQFLSLT